MTAWQDFSAGDFDQSKAPKYIRRNAEAGQESLFTTGTPTLPAKPAPVRPELPGQGGLFGDGDQGAEDSASEAGHAPDPDPEHGAFDVCRKCGQPIVQHWATGQWVPMTGTASAACYGRRS